MHTYSHNCIKFGHATRGVYRQKVLTKGHKSKQTPFPIFISFYLVLSN